MPDDQDPSQLYTPGTLANQRLYAQALMQQGMGTITPSSGGAVSPFQGLAGILEGIQGRQLLRNSGPQEVQARARAAEAANPTAPGEEDQQPSGGGPLTARAPGSSSMGFTDPISRYAAATSAQESGGNYNALGPVIKSPMTGQPDRAFGRYGVMGANIPQWTSEVLGKPMTPQEFLQNPQAQDAVYKAKFGQLAAKYGPEGAAKAWFAGEGGMNNQNAKDINGMTVAKYGNNFSNALAFNGEPSGAPTGAAGGPLSASPPGAPGSPALALQRPAMGLPSPSMAPAQAAGGSAQDQPAGTLPMRPRVSRQQFISSSNPWINSADQQSVRDMYYSQNQPLQMQGPYGSTIIVDPRNPNNRWVMPGPVQMEHTKAGDVEVPTPMVTMPPGSSVAPPNIQKVIPSVAGDGSQGGSGAAPQAAQPQPDMPHDLVPQKATPFADEEGAAQGGLPDVITKGPEAAQAARGNGMLAFAPPGAPTSGAAPQAPVGQQIAQQGAGGAPDLNRMSPAELANWSQQRDIQTTAAKEFNKADIDNYNKDYANYQTIGSKAVNSGQAIALAQKIIHDPHFTQGPGTDIKLAWEKAKAFMGDQGAQTNLAYNQAFEKVIAGNILGDMRSQLQGLGQVRLAEIALLNKAAASPHNTIGANQAILDIAAKSQQQLQELGKITNWYRQGYRWDDNGKLITDQSGKPVIGNDRPTSAGQNAAIRTYLMNNPMLSDEQIKHYDSLLDAAEKGGGGVAQGPLSTKPPAAPAPVPQGMTPQQAAAAAAAEKLRRQQPAAQPEIPM